MRRIIVRLLGPLFAVGVLAVMPAVAEASGTFLGQFNTISTIASTVPSNGDVNPYGVANVPISAGRLVQGRVLVSNFNNSANLQGTGTTIVEINPYSGSRSLFAQINPNRLPGPCPGGVGLTTALTALRSGFVIVGSLPTTDGTAATARAGCLLVLDSWGNVVETISGAPINGPWDMTTFDDGSQVALFVANVLNGTVAGNGNVVNRGTIVRLQLGIGNRPFVESETVIGSGFSERTDPAALVIGPTGEIFDDEGNLFVADSLNNRIAEIPNAFNRSGSAGHGITITQGGFLNDPLGMRFAPNEDILTVNGNDGNVVETTEGGAQVAKKLLDNTGSPPGAGTLFGLAIVPGGGGVYFVDDGTNTLNLLH